MKIKKAVLAVLSLLLCASCGEITEDNAGDTTETDNIIQVETTEKTEKIEELTETVLSDWFDYLYASDYLYGDMLWAVSYTEQFFENPIWENLQMARVAAVTAEKYITVRNMPEAAMTAEDYILMLQAGYDVSAVETEALSYEVNKTIALNDCYLIRQGLSSEIFWKISYEDFRKSVELMRETYEKNLQYLNTATEHLLLTLNDDAWSEKFHTFVAENCPTLPGYKTEIPAEIDAVYAEADRILDEIEAANGRKTEHIGELQATIYRMEDIIAGGDLSELQNNAMEFAGMPISLPFSGWNMAAGTEYFYYVLEDGSNHYPVEQEELTGKPDGWLFEYPLVPKEDLIAYQTLLSDCGLEPSDIKDTEDEYKLTYFLGDVAFMLTWDTEKVTFFAPEGNIDFNPVWYLLR